MKDSYYFYRVENREITIIYFNHLLDKPKNTLNFISLKNILLPSVTFKFLIYFLLLTDVFQVPRVSTGI